MSVWVRRASSVLIAGMALTLGLVLMSPFSSQNDSPKGAPPVMRTKKREVGEQDRLILALGDSLTEGVGVERAGRYAEQVRRMLAAQNLVVHLVDYAKSGYRVRDLVLMLNSSDPIQLNADVIVVCIGTNDVVHGSDIEDFKRDLDTLNQLVAQLEGRLVLVLPIPDWSRLPNPERLGDPATIHQRVEAFNNVLKHRAGLSGWKWFDISEAMDQAMANGELVADGLHPNAAGYQRWSQPIAEYLASRWKD